MQETYFMIKPEIVAAGDQKIGAILAMVNASGFRIVDLALRRLDRSLVETFYGEHRGKPFYDSLVAYICSGPVVCARLAREDAASRLRELIGATDPAKAATGTIRFLYGKSLSYNAVHASANPEDAARELALIFGR
ncbi:MAG TPA: nucleoside-diphosphate kinase [Candidatus Krumholzibacteria bacterium]|nr:nucleoside-diphosphate kinase [Candidatus Krumholzibacteria bacterium]HPD71485.1 nucleoside-diphosphate kinase [Candidatus Krumholzibacteria bacterium]HRY41582.1 nucleoside-diphosphate kinase [Candidatus Krumholzibacteria bacterium]